MLRSRRWLAHAVCLTLAGHSQVFAQADASPLGDTAEVPAVDATTDEARRLFAEGLDFVESEDWVQAEERFRRVLAMRGSHVVAYNLASALDHLGRLVEAAELLRPIARDASVEPRTKAAAERLLGQVEPRIGSLTVRLSGDSQGALVRLDDKQVQISEQVLTVSVDPGTHRVVVERDGVIVASRTVDVGSEGSLQTSIAIDVPPRLGHGADDAGATARRPAIPLGSLTPVGRRAPSAAVEPGPEPRDDGGDSLFESPWLWVGVGALAIGAGVTVALLATNEDSAPVRGDTDPPVLRGKVALLELP
jgi:hypothetical protein